MLFLVTVINVNQILFAKTFLQFTGDDKLNYRVLHFWSRCGLSGKWIPETFKGWFAARKKSWWLGSCDCAKISHGNKHLQYMTATINNMIVPYISFFSWDITDCSPHPNREGNVNDLFPVIWLVVYYQ